MHSALLLLRHGHTAYNSGSGEERVRGWRNVPLDEQGIEEAKELARRVAEEFHFSDLSRPPLIYSSDLSRAEVTAGYVAQPLGLRVELVRELRPWNLGNLQGTPAKSAAKIFNKFALECPDTRIPGGESYKVYESRALGFLQELLDRVLHNESQLAVTHFRNLHLLESYIRGNGKVDMKYFTHPGNDPTGGGIEVTYSPTGWQVRSLVSKASYATSKGS